MTKCTAHVPGSDQHVHRCWKKQGHMGAHECNCYFEWQKKEVK